jgi:hypothetical protein
MLLLPGKSSFQGESSFRRWRYERSKSNLGSIYPSGLSPTSTDPNEKGYDMLFAPWIASDDSPSVEKDGKLKAWKVSPSATWLYSLYRHSINICIPSVPPEFSHTAVLSSIPQRIIITGTFYR